MSLWHPIVLLLRYAENARKALLFIFWLFLNWGCYDSRWRCIVCTWPAWPSMPKLVTRSSVGPTWRCWTQSLTWGETGPPLWPCGWWTHWPPRSARGPRARAAALQRRRGWGYSEAERGVFSSTSVKMTLKSSLFSSPAVRQGRRSLCDNTGRLLRGVGGVRCDWFGLVGLAREENETVAGREPSSLEVQSGPVTPSVVSSTTDSSWCTESLCILIQTTETTAECWTNSHSILIRLV